jgi:putative hemolysin
MEDLVEELIGDIQDEYDIDGPEHEVATLGVVTVAGLLNIEDFSEETGVHVPDGPYETVAGFVISLLGRVPLLGDTVTAGGHVFEVVELDGLRVSRVRVTHEPEAETEAEGVADAESSGATE